MSDEPRRIPAAEQLAGELSDIAEIAEELGLLDEPGHGAHAAVSVLDYLDSTRWNLADYVLRGERTRRMVNAPNPVVEAALAAHGDGALERAARILTTRAGELSGQVRRTNTVVARWLVAHRVAVANPCYLDTNELFNRYRRGVLDPAAVSEDPLYLLVCHLSDVLSEAAEWDDPDAPGLMHLKAQLTLPMRAVQDEMAAAMAHYAAALGVTRTLSRLEAG